MSRIITVTLNTALDYLIELDELTAGALHSTENARQTPAGKGVNVARTLDSLEHPVYLRGFAGTENTAQFESLSSGHMHPEFIPVAGSTRINVTIHEKAAARSTHIRTPGYTVQHEHLQALRENLAEFIAPDDFVVLTGSLPRGAPDSLYADVIRIIRKNGGVAILDTSGSALRKALVSQPDILAPNQEEIETLTGATFHGEEDCKLAVTRLAEKYELPLVVVSLGEQGLLAFQLKTQEYFRVRLNHPVAKPIISDVGCGDALLGGLVFGLSDGRSLSESLRFAAACGTANLLNGVPGSIEKDQVNHFLELHEIA